MKMLRKIQDLTLKLGAFALGVLALSSGNAVAGVGFGDNSDANGQPIKQQTFYAGSPSGLHSPTGCYNSDGTQYDPVSGAPLVPTVGVKCDSGAALQKFVDDLPGLALPGGPNHNVADKYIPVAVATKWANTNDDYYEIAVVEFTEKFHTGLVTATTLRGYVQIDPIATSTGGASWSANSMHIPLVNPVGNGNAPIMINGKQAYGYDAPHYLGPVIVAKSGVATRLKFYNLLPVGHSKNGQRNGDLFLPVDETLPGAGFGPDVNAAGEGLLKYTQNRAEVHLHGGDNPWISDGTPHQWITPAGESDLSNDGTGTKPLSVAKEAVNKGLIDPLKIANYTRGASTRNVPDMPDPGPGAVTYYFPNGESSRLMFYHDHSFGLTRLNVYAGEAAGYVLRDDKVDGTDANGNPVVGSLVEKGLLPAAEVPLIIQDKSFVPKDIAIQDSKWDTNAWGTEGNLYFPHVYETNQDPTSFDGTKPVGRWDWGPYFWPVFPSFYDRLPSGENVLATQTVGGVAVNTGLTEVSTTPEAFMDTPIVNGVAYPKMTVEPKAYRFRFLNASNDRFMNIGLYVAADKETIDPNEPRNPLHQPTLCDGSLRPANQTTWDALGNVIPHPLAGIEPSLDQCTEVKMVYFDHSFPSAYYPTGPNSTAAFPTSGGLLDTGWGDPTGHIALWSGVPDPTTAGPDIHMIGDEGGVLPNLVSIPSTPANYEANRRSVTVMNVMEHGLYLSTAGRADTVIDFSQYAGKTLILYNDAPAPVPALDPRIDYYTGMGDYSTVGGHENVKPGYGPNTRTVMQIQVLTTLKDGSSPATAAAAQAKIDALTAAIPGVYAATQPKPIVPEMAYNAAFPSIASQDTFGRIYQGSIYLGKFQGLSFTAAEGMKYTTVPTIANGTICANPQDCADNLKPGAAVAVAGQKVNAYIENKAIQELFDPTYGRMNATLGVEVPFTGALTQTTIPLGYVDPTTETVADGETQFWKITHNGVDTHPVHFHLVNVQIINRVGWDGTIKAITAAETGWKETVIMNPLEDIIVAVRAKAPKLPFGLMNSVRLRDPSQPQGVMTGFTQINLVTGATLNGVAPNAVGAPLLVTNDVEDYGWEYVWHCHILGHEENDFMRPFKFNYTAQLPDAPVLTAPSTAAVNANIVLSWTDGTALNGVATLGNAKNEAGFKVMRMLVSSANPVWTLVNLNSSNNVNTTTYTDKVAVAGIYKYRIDAYNQAGVSPSAETSINIGNVATAMQAVTNLTAVANATIKRIDLAWTDLSTAETAYRVERCTWTNNGVNECLGNAAVTSGNNQSTQTNRWFTLTTTAGANVVGQPNLANVAKAYSDVTAQVVAGKRYTYRVTPLIGAVGALYSNLAQVTTPAPDMLTATVVNGTTTLPLPVKEQIITFPVGGLAYDVVQTNVVNGTIVTKTNVTTATLSMAAPLVGADYSYDISRGTTGATTTNPWLGNGTTTLNLLTEVAPATPAKPTNFTNVKDTSLTFGWSIPAVVAGVVNRYEVQVCKPITAATCNSNTNWKAAVGFAGVIGSPSGETFGVTGFGSPTVSIAPNTAYMFRVRALNPWGNSSYLTSAAQTTLPSQVTSLAGVTAADPINVGKSKVTLSWVNPNVGITPTVKVMLNGVVVANTVGNVGNIGAPTTVAGVTSVTISNLKPSLLHTFTVSTSNAATGTASASIDVTTATAALGNFVTLAPGSLTANSLTLNWLNSNGIAPAVKVALAGSATPLQIAPADLVVTTTGVAIANLTPNTSYDVSVTVGNQTQTTTQQTAAAPITALPVSGLSSTGVTLHWVNTNAGPLPTISGGGLINVISPTSATVTNLTPNTFYNFVVTVAGQVTQISVTTNSANVTNLAVSSVTNTSANVNWTNPTDGGNAVLTVSPNTVGIVITPNGTASGAVVTGLSPSTLYTFSVSVTGSNGLPSVTVVQTATTLAALQAPINLVATKTDLTTIRITWQDSSVGETGAYIRLIDTTANPRTTVVLDGGVGLSSPKVGGTITTVISNLALIPGHVYFINVNAMSAGTYSVSAAGAYVTDASITASATLLTVTNVTQDSASVSWINPVGGGNAVLTVSPSTVGVVITPNGTGNGAVVAGLNANTSYTFSVIVTATNLTPSIATTANVTTLAPVLLVPTNITPIMTGTTLQVTWTDNSLGETGAYLRLVDTTANPRTTVVLDGGAGLASPNVGGTITAVVNNLTLIPGHVYFMNVNPLFGGSFGPAGGAYVK